MTERTPCPECAGTGWTCLTCERSGRECTCTLDAQEAMDCQSCQGSGDANDVDTAGAADPVPEG